MTRSRFSGPAQHGSKKIPPELLARAKKILAAKTAKFRAWRTPQGRSPQGEVYRALRDGARVIVLRCANQTGKTTVGSHLVTVLASGQLAWREIPIRGWVACRSWGDVGSVIWPKWREFVDYSDLVGGKPGWVKTDLAPSSLTWKNGSSLEIKTYEMKPAAFAGATLDLIWLDEEAPAPIVRECRTRLLRRKGLLIVTCTPVQGSRWLRDLEREPRTRTIEINMYEACDAGILDRESVELYEASLPDREARVRVWGEHGAREGLVYPEWSPEHHILRPYGRDRTRLKNLAGTLDLPYPLPDTWLRFAAMDFGMANPGTVLVGAMPDSRDLLVIERCYYARGVRVSPAQGCGAPGWADVIKPLQSRWSAGLVCDHDAIARAELGEAGIATVAARKDVTRGIEAVARWLQIVDGEPPRLAVILDDRNPPRHPATGRCDAQALVREIDDYRWQEKREEGDRDKPDAPIKANDHAMDALRYLIMSFEMPAVDPTASLGLTLRPTSEPRDSLRETRPSFGPRKPGYGLFG